MSATNMRSVRINQNAENQSFGDIIYRSEQGEETVLRYQRIDREFSILIPENDVSDDVLVGVVFENRRGGLRRPPVFDTDTEPNVSHPKRIDRLKYLQAAAKQDEFDFTVPRFIDNPTISFRL